MEIKDSRMFLNKNRLHHFFRLKEFKSLKHTLNKVEATGNRFINNYIHL